MKKVLVLLMLALLPLGAFAQKDTRETQSQITYDIPANGPQGGVPQNFDKARVNEIVAQIRNAKIAGDVQRSEQLQLELERVTGNISERSNGNSNGPQAINQVLNQPISETDYNMTVINSDGNWAVATTTDRVTGRIYVATTKYDATGSDSLKVFSSTDNGIHWVLVNKISYGSAIDFRNDELDIEAVNNGTTSYVYIVAGFSFSGVNYSGIYRLNSSGGEFYSSSLYTAAAGNGFVNPRITSDNSNYTTASYVYVILTQDSLTATGVHALRTKFSLITSSFVAAPVMIYRNFNGATNSYYWQTSGAADTSILYSDIAYSDSATTDKIVTVSNFYRLNLNNLYLIYSSDYGATLPTYAPQIAETKVNYKPRLACNGYDDVSLTQNIFMTYVRQFSATDWDSYYQRTTNNGSVWAGGYIDASTDTTVSSDVIAITRSPNTFRVAYSTMTNNSEGKAFLRTFNAGTLSARFQLNVTPSAVSFSPVRAGYRLAATDSCFTVVEGALGGSSYAYSGCSGTLTGTGNSETPVSFKLSQNYPNPFNPTTKISYALPKSGLVTLRVYDVLGREVATLVNEVKNAGSYTVDFSASNFTSGVYFYKLETNGLSDIKKMMLIK